MILTNSGENAIVPLIWFILAPSSLAKYLACKDINLHTHKGEYGFNCVQLWIDDIAGDDFGTITALPQNDKNCPKNAQK